MSVSWATEVTASFTASPRGVLPARSTTSVLSGRPGVGRMPRAIGPAAPPGAAPGLRSTPRWCSARVSSALERSSPATRTASSATATATPTRAAVTERLRRGRKPPRSKAPVPHLHSAPYPHLYRTSLAAVTMLHEPRVGGVQAGDAARALGLGVQKQGNAAW